MAINNNDYLQLIEFKKFHNLYLHNFDKNRSSSFVIEGLLNTICDYYELSLTNYEIYKVSIKNWTDNNFTDKKNDPEQDKLRSKMIASVFGIYTNGNVCLQIVRQLNEYIKEFSENQDEKLIINLNEIRENNRKWTDDFREKRNTVIVHPIQSKNKKGNCDCFPDRRAELSMFGTGGFEFNIYSLITGHKHKKLEINPYTEIKQLRDYLESLVPIYSNFFEISFD